VKFDAKERPPMAGGGGLGVGAMRREVALKRGDRREVDDGRADEWRVDRFVERARSAARLRGKKRKGGGVRPRECHAARDGVIGPGLDRRAPMAVRAGRR
jgi:hypothetical protein